MARALDIEWHGAVRYADGLALQDRAVAQRITGDRNDRVLLLEHPAVVTPVSYTHLTLPTKRIV